MTSGTGTFKLENTWVHRVFSWIQAVFPNEKHKLLNKAVPAVTSAYISPCVLDMLPADVDIVFMEFTFNDAEQSSSLNMDDPTRYRSDLISLRCILCCHMHSC